MHRKTKIHQRTSIFLVALIALLAGFVVAVVSPGRTQIRELAGLVSNPEMEFTEETEIELAANREVESGYYQMSIEEVRIPGSVLADLTIKGRVVQYLAAIEPNRIAVLLGSNSLPLGIVPNDLVPTLALEDKSHGAVLVLASVVGGSIEFFSDPIILSDSVPTLSQVRDLEYMGNGRFLVSNVDVSQNCYALELWELTVVFEGLRVDESKRLFRSEPCISEAIQVAETGGRIGRLKDGAQVLLTVGSFGISTPFDLFGERYDSRPALLTPPNPYGSTILITPDTEPTIFSSGHRNTQGLFVDIEKGDIWGSEQGPRGGDELNLLQMGSDYGWPDESIGTSYLGPRPIDQFEQDPWASRHRRFTRPVYSWIPSVAPSQLVKYEGDEFSLWNEDLIVTTLRDQSLRRLRIESNTVLVDERIEIGRRVRDIVVLEDGRILLSLDDGFLAVVGVANSND